MHPAYPSNVTSHLSSGNPLVLACPAQGPKGLHLGPTPPPPLCPTPLPRPPHTVVPDQLPYASLNTTTAVFRHYVAPTNPTTPLPTSCSHSRSRRDLTPAAPSSPRSGEWLKWRPGWLREVGVR